MSAPGQHNAGQPETFKLDLPGWRLAIGLFAAPAAWLAQMTGSEALAAGACYPHQQPLAAAALAHLHDTLLLVSLTGVLIAILFPGFAIGPALLRARRETKAHHVIETGEGRSYFLLMTGMLVSILFAIAALLTATANFMVTPCHPW